VASVKGCICKKVKEIGKQEVGLFTGKREGKMTFCKLRRGGKKKKGALGIHGIKKKNNN